MIVANTFEQQLHEQLNHLNTQITQNKNSKFLIFNLEAGLGKSLQAEQSMIDAWIIHQRKTLYVTQFKDTNGFDNIHNRINSKAGKFIAWAVDSHNKNEYKDLSKIPIIIITHEMYKRLSYNTAERNKFIKDRYNLIIDEMPNMVNILTYTKDRIKQIHDMLPMTISAEYTKIIGELYNCLTVNEHKRNIFFNAQKKYTRALGRLKTLIQTYISADNFTNATLKYTTFNYETNAESVEYIDFTKSKLLEEIEIVRSFYSNSCCVDRGKIYTYDKRVKYFTLENNILLDANGGFQELYSLGGNLFNMNNVLDRIVDHSDWKMVYSKINTNTTAKSKYVNFEEFVQGVITHLHNTKDNLKLLLVSSKSHKSKFNNITTAHFGNIIGKNEWRDYNCVFLVHNPQTPFYVYILKYLYYAGCKLDNRSTWSTYVTDAKPKTVKFTNDAFEKVRISDLCGHLYQAIKRINRDNSQDALVYIFNADSDVMNLVIKQMKGMKVTVIDDFDKFIKKQFIKNIDEEDKGTYSNKFIVLLDDIIQGVYDKEKDVEISKGIRKVSKQWCINHIEFKTPNKFSERILKNLDVIQFMTDNHIVSKGKYMVFNTH